MACPPSSSSSPPSGMRETPTKCTKRLSLLAACKFGSGIRRLPFIEDVPCVYRVNALLDLCRPCLTLASEAPSL